MTGLCHVRMVLFNYQAALNTGEGTTQEQVFQDCQGVVQSVLSGYNGTILGRSRVFCFAHAAQQYVLTWSQPCTCSLWTDRQRQDAHSHSEQRSINMQLSHCRNGGFVHLVCPLQGPSIYPLAALLPAVRG